MRPPVSRDGRSDRMFLSDVLATQIPQDAISTVFFAHTVGGGVPSRRATILGAPRLVVCRRGRRNHSFLGPNGVVTVTLEPGQALFVRRDCWLDTWYDADNEAASIVFGTPRTRVLYLRYRRADDPDNTMRATPAPLEFVGADPRVSAFVQELSASFDRPAWYAANIAECLLFQLAQAIGRPEPSRTGKAELRYELIRSYVDENCQEPVTRLSVGEAFGIHPSHVSRLFSRFSGLSFSEYVTRTRLERAKRLLSDQKETVAEVAHQCGFASPSYFARVFRSRTGRTPVAFRTASARSSG